MKVLFHAGIYPEPVLEVSQETSRVLDLAFGSARDERIQDPLDSVRLLDTARKTNLLALIGSRLVQRHTRCPEPWSEAATRAYRVAAARHLVMVSALHEIDRILSKDEIPWVALKFAGLALGGYITPGEREAGDLDLLVEPRDLPRATRALIEAGFAAKGGRDAEHQTDPLFSRTLNVCVELHRLVLGVRMPGSDRSLTLGALQRENLVAAPPDGYRSCLIPCRDVLVAHATVHGLAQHGLRPQEYPLFRLPSDIISLAGPTSPTAAIRSAAPLMSSVLAPDLIDAFAELCEGLSTGALVRDLNLRESSPAVRLFRHMLASSLSTEYASSLESLYMRNLLTDRTSIQTLMQVAFDRLFLTRSEAERVSGKQLSLAGYLEVLLKNPLRLFKKVAKSGGSTGAPGAPIQC